MPHRLLYQYYSYYQSCFHHHHHHHHWYHTQIVSTIATTRHTFIIIPTLLLCLQCQCHSYDQRYIHFPTSTAAMNLVPLQLSYQHASHDYSASILDTTRTGFSIIQKPLLWLQCQYPSCYKTFFPCHTTTVVMIILPITKLFPELLYHYTTTAASIIVLLSQLLPELLSSSHHHHGHDYCASSIAILIMIPLLLTNIVPVSQLCHYHIKTLATTVRPVIKILQASYYRCYHDNSTSIIATTRATLIFIPPLLP